ncbi:MAG TPA: hypothetical protein VFZ89_05455 [Solirubrobacteraceae bacterium]
MANRFFLWGMHDAEPAAFTPSPDGTGDHPDVRYFLRVAHELDALRPGGDETFLLTWHADRFEERFRDSVVLFINDEKHQVPSYAGAVRAIFKTGGVHRNPLRHTLRFPPSVSSRLLLREARNLALAARRRLRTRQTRGAPLYDVPLGYFGLEDVPAIAFDERPVDVSFAGSVEPEHFTLRPRLAARWQMAAALEAAAAQIPDLRVDFSPGGPMANPQEMLAAGDYSTRLMRSRIVLCPRGNIDETYRLLESARSGCVAITERLPERWYYRDSPAVQLERWADLPGVLRELLADPVALAERGAAMRRWWDAALDEKAVARYIARHIDALDG